MKKSNSWKAPHQPVRSRDLTQQALLCGALTDRKIFHYMLIGRYGRDAQRRAQAQQKKPKSERQDSLAAAKKFLNHLLHD